MTPKHIPVGIVQTTARITEVTLEDGTVLHLQVVPTQVSRIDGAHDRDGNPAYYVSTQAVITVASAVPSLKKVQPPV